MLSRVVVFLLGFSSYPPNQMDSFLCFFLLSILMSFSDEVTKRQKFIRFLTAVIAVVLIVTITLAILAYPEPYEFFNEAVSNLGGTLSETGLDNSNSLLIMVIGFWVIASISFIIGLIYLTSPILKHNFVKAFWTLAMAVGAVGVSIPLDLFPKIHYFGASVFIFSFGLYNFNCQVLRYTRKHRPDPNRRSFNYWLDVIVAWLLLLSIVAYFAIFALDHFGITMPLSWITTALAQKIVLILAIFAVLILDVKDI